MHKKIMDNITDKEIWKAYWRLKLTRNSLKIRQKYIRYDRGLYSLHRIPCWREGEKKYMGGGKKWRNKQSWKHFFNFIPSFVEKNKKNMWGEKKMNKWALKTFSFEENKIFCSRSKKNLVQNIHPWDMDKYVKSRLVSLLS